jgi:hypothetical protein
VGRGVVVVKDSKWFWSLWIEVILTWLNYRK